MPFQDKEEDTEVTAAPRVPTVPERWLRKMFLEDWGLKLLALAITIVLWLGITGQNLVPWKRAPECRPDRAFHLHGSTRRIGFARREFFALRCAVVPAHVRAR